jgi:hypothetical protein
MTQIEQKREELKPCPFCGGEAEIKQNCRNGFKLKCKKCTIGYAQKTLHFSLDWLEAKMIEHWNQRTELVELKEQETIGEVYDKEPIEKFLGEVPSGQQPQGAEEILDKYSEYSSDIDKDCIVVEYTDAIKSMQKYRLQGIRKELIRFSQQFYSDEETCISNVDKYLNK